MRHSFKLNKSSHRHCLGVLILSTLISCSTMPSSDSFQSDWSAILADLREAHGIAEAKHLFSGPFQQGWQQPPETEFEPGVAELWATDEALHVLAVLGDRDIGNHATGFNEKTWQSGDVFEIFIQTDADTYYEFHTTPENKHLFLTWTAERIAAFRNKKARLGDAMLTDRRTLRSETQIREDEAHWTVHARIPFEKIGLDPGAANAEVKVAFARYDAFGDGRPPVLSATPDFPKKNFHDRSVWHPIRF